MHYGTLPAWLPIVPRISLLSISNSHDTTLIYRLELMAGREEIQRALRRGPYMIPVRATKRDIRRYILGSFPLVLGSASGPGASCLVDSARTGARSKASEVYRSTPPAYRYEAAAMSLPQASKSLESIAACLSSTQGHFQTPRPSHRLLLHPAIMPSPRHFGQSTELSKVGGRFPRDRGRPEGHNLP